MKLIRIAFLFTLASSLFQPVSASTLIDPFSHILKPVLTYSCVAGSQYWHNRNLADIPNGYNTTVFINLNGDPTFTENTSIIKSIGKSLSKLRVKSDVMNALFFIMPAYKFYHFVLDPNAIALSAIHNDIAYVGLPDEVLGNKQMQTLKTADLSSNRIFFFRDGRFETSFPFSRSSHSQPGSDTLLASLVREAFIGKQIPESMPTITHSRSVDGEIDVHFRKLPVGTYKFSRTQTSLIIPEMVFGEEYFAVKRRTPSGSFVIDYLARPPLEKKD